MGIKFSTIIIFIFILMIGGCNEDDTIVFSDIDDEPIYQTLLGTWQTRTENWRDYSDGRPADTLINHVARTYYSDDTFFDQPWAISPLNGDTVYFSFTTTGRWWILASDSILLHSAIDPLWVTDDEAFFQSRERLDISTLSTGKIYSNREMTSFIVENSDTIFIRNRINTVYKK